MHDAWVISANNRDWCRWMSEMPATSTYSKNTPHSLCFCSQRLLRAIHKFFNSQGILISLNAPQPIWNFPIPPSWPHSLEASRSRLNIPWVKLRPFSHEPPKSWLVAILELYRTSSNVCLPCSPSSLNALTKRLIYAQTAPYKKRHLMAHFFWELGTSMTAAKRIHSRLSRSMTDVFLTLRI